MSKRTLKDMEQDQAALNRGFEDLDREKARLAKFEFLSMDYARAMAHPLRQLDYQVTNTENAAALSQRLLELTQFERRLEAIFMDAEAALKKKERQLEEKQDKLASEKKKFYMEEDDGH